MQRKTFTNVWEQLARKKGNIWTTSKLRGVFQQEGFHSLPKSVHHWLVILPDHHQRVIAYQFNTHKYEIRLVGLEV